MTTKEKDYFAFVKWGPKEIEIKTEFYIQEKRNSYKTVAELPEKKLNFDSVIGYIESTEAAISYIRSSIYVLNQVSPKKEVRDTCRKCEEKISKKLIDIFYDKKIFNAIKYVYEHDKNLNQSQAKLLDEYHKIYKRMGFGLQPKKISEIKKIQKEITKISIGFNKTLNEWKDHILVTREELAGLPEVFINSLSKKDGKYKITLETPHYMPFMAQATNSVKRKELADKQAIKGGKENLKYLKQLIVLRKKLAKMLGYKNFVDYMTEMRTAGSSKKVGSFLLQLQKKLAPLAKKDIQIMLKYKKENLRENDSVMYYDINFLIEQTRKELFNLDSNIVREYLEINHVLKKFILIIKKVFGVNLILRGDIKAWHKDVFVFEAKEGSETLGYIVFDLFPRENKYGHAMVTPLRDMIPGKQHPVCALVMNVAKPSKNTPSLLSLYDVETLFHEFGHALHFISSKPVYVSQSGFGVPIDFVEVPSQFVEQWPKSKEVLSMIGRHYKTNKRIPSGIIEKIVQSQLHMNGYFYLGLAVKSQFDVEIHIYTIRYLEKYYSSLMKKYLVEPSKKSLYPASFLHLAGGYEGGYYSYLWSLVYAYDLFGEFKKKGILNGDLGMKFRKHVLEPGASKKEIDLVRDFLGREPSNKAFLNELGIK